jgi:hypothetical protein
LGVAKEYVVLGTWAGSVQSLDGKLPSETLIIGSASNLNLTIKNKVPKDGDAVSIYSSCVQPDQSGLSRYCFVKVDDRVGSLTSNSKPKSVTFQYHSDMFKEAKLSISVTKGQEVITRFEVIPLIDKKTVEYLIEY